MDLVNLPLVSAGASHLEGTGEHPGSGVGSRSDSSPACLLQVSAESWGVQEVGLETRLPRGRPCVWAGHRARSGDELQLLKQTGVLDSKIK